MLKSRIALACLALTGLALVAADANAVPICIDDICVEVPTPNDSGYNVRAGDFNSDGRTDLYVTGGYRRAVKDFILLQNAPNSSGEITFSISPSPPTAAQRAQALSSPQTSVAVYRTDLSGDGLFDFHLENVDEVIPNAPDIIVLTNRGEGEMPVKVIEEDDDFLALVDDIERILEFADVILNVYNSLTCVPVFTYVPVYIPYTYYYGEYGYYYYGYYTYVPYVYYSCVPTSIFFYGHYQTFIGSMNDLMATFPSNITSFVDGELQAVLEARYGVDRVRWTRRLANAIRAGLTAVRYYRKAALVATTILVADDVTVVGVADDVAIPVLVLSLGGSYIIEAALDKAASALDDFAERVEAEVDPATDPYRVKNDCDPWGASQSTQIKARIGRPPQDWLDPSSERLRTNLDKAGCGCPPGKNVNAAHHIVPKKGGGAIGDQARACLHNAGIDLDEAGNGVCLPTNDNAKTNAIKHSSEGMHSDAYYRAILDKCTNAYSSGQSQGVRNMLDQLRQNFARGEKFW